MCCVYVHACVYCVCVNSSTCIFVYHCVCDLLTDIDECSTDDHNCGQKCVNTEGSYVCDCWEGYALNSDGRTCRVSCVGTYTARNGSFHTPGWPRRYPLYFRCEWLIQPTSVTRNTIIVLTVDQEYFGIYGSSPCNTDYLEFHDGNTTDAHSLGKYCQFNAPNPLYTSGSQALIIFRSGVSLHLPSHVGVKVFYQLFELGTILLDMYKLQGITLSDLTLICLLSK